MLRKDLFYCYYNDGNCEAFYCTSDARTAFKYVYSSVRRLNCIFPSTMLYKPSMNFTVFKGYKPCYNFNVKMSRFTMNPPAGCNATPVYFSDTFLDYFKYFSNDEHPMPLVMEPVHLLHQTDATVIKRIYRIKCDINTYTTIDESYNDNAFELTDRDKSEVRELFKTLNLIWYTRSANNG